MQDSKDNTSSMTVEMVNTRSSRIQEKKKSLKSDMGKKEVIPQSVEYCRQSLLSRIHSNLFSAQLLPTCLAKAQVSYWDGEDTKI